MAAPTGRGLRQVRAGVHAPGCCLKKDLCAQEFEALRSCFAAAAKKTLTGGRYEGLQAPIHIPGCLALMISRDKRLKPQKLLGLKVLETH